MSPADTVRIPSIIDSDAFRRKMRGLVAHSVRRDMPSIQPLGDVSQPAWNYLLLAASALTAIQTEEAQDTALRIAQSTLAAEQTTVVQRQAAALMLERLGNLPALRLAQSRNLVTSEQWANIPIQLAVDTQRRLDELTIRLSSGRTLDANQFQREFWDLAVDNKWISVSAPTSAGKTRIVREWITHLFENATDFRAAYIAPTRALVQEVSASLKQQLGPAVRVHTLPWDSGIGEEPREMYVVTQERMHLLQQRGAFAPDFVFVDEAQSVGDRSRGILLSSVLDEAVARRPAAQIIFASPLTSNPEVMLEGAPDNTKTTSLLSETVTVNQNLLYVGQVSRKPSRFRIEINHRGDVVTVGEFSIGASRAAVGQRLAFIASALGGDSGNIIYANGPGDAEKFANQLFDMLGTDADVRDDAVDNAVDFIRASVHPNFALATVIRRGIGFHYGDIPLPVKTLVEDLFRSGRLKYLVCTSTLLEGVNLPCRNIFLRGPRKGRGNPMTAADFWNLGGRAGRWGTEFQGNIVCVDITDRSAWPDPPAPRTRRPIVKAAERSLKQPVELVAYIASGAMPANSEVPEELEASFSFLAGRRSDGRPLSAIYGLKVPDKDLAELQQRVDIALTGIRIPAELIRRHAGISPLSMDRLYGAIAALDAPESLALVPPESDDALDAYKTSLDWIAAYLGGPFENDKRRFALSRLIVNWMNGVPLARLIDYRIRWKRDQSLKVNVAATIREIMSDVEKIARFVAPKYLSCFNDVVLYRMFELGATPSDEPDITMMLELGVPRLTDMGLINAGLSRATAMTISQFIAASNLSSAQCLAWLRERGVETLGLPAFALREVQELLASTAPRVGEI